MSDVRNAVGQVTYADAGVDVDEGARAVDAIKAAVATTAFLRQRLKTWTIPCW